MADLEDEEQPATQTAEPEQGCPVRMRKGQPCGRPIYGAPFGVDDVPVCLMHSRDPQKDNLEFREEFQRILLKSPEGPADFSRFVFPLMNFLIYSFEAECIFIGAVFAQDVDFSRAVFHGRVHFDKTRFSGNADFGETEFRAEARFFDARFEGHVLFSEAVFNGIARFRDATFMQNALFRHTRFDQGADFVMTTFQQYTEFSVTDFVGEAGFTESNFAGEARFDYTKFILGAEFWGATFEQVADFSSVVFSDCAEFGSARFMKGADFSQAMFTQGPDFEETTFAEMVDFRTATFKERVEFRGTIFREDGSALPGPVFSQAHFAKPELALFYNTCLGQALFHNCDVSRFVFSSVRWRRRSNGKSMVLEDDVELDLSQEVNGALCTQEGDADDRNYGLIAELYQQLKKNYDDKRDYWTAGDFHYGEMEMKRLATPQPNRLSRWLKNMGLTGARFEVFRRSWHRHVGLAALYKYASEYGESYNVPLLWLAGFLLLFMSLYPVLGLHPALKAGGGQAAVHDSLFRDAGAPELSYRNYIHYGSLQPGGEKLSFPALLGHSLMTSVGVAALQRDLAYEPSYPWGRALSWFELALTSTLIALFLLAVRRQFRR